MKTNILRMTAALALTAATLANPMYAGDKKPKAKDSDETALAWSKIEPYGYSKKVEVSFEATNSDRPASVKILNEDKEVIFRDYIKHPHTFRKVYDLNQLGEGVYTLQITTGRSQTEKTFALGEILHEDAVRVIFLAGSDAQHFRFGMENPTKADVDLLVKDSAGQVVSQEKLRNISKKLVERDYSSLAPGEYTVEVTSAKGEFSKKIMVP